MTTSDGTTQQMGTIIVDSLQYICLAGLSHGIDLSRSAGILCFRNATSVLGLPIWNADLVVYAQTYMWWEDAHPDHETLDREIQKAFNAFPHFTHHIKLIDLTGNTLLPPVAYHFHLTAPGEISKHLEETVREVICQVIGLKK